MVGYTAAPVGNAYRRRQIERTAKTIEKIVDKIKLS